MQLVSRELMRKGMQAEDYLGQVNNMKDRVLWSYGVASTRLEDKFKTCAARRTASCSLRCSACIQKRRAAAARVLSCIGLSFGDLASPIKCWIWH